jgi:hypothetical protein
MARTERTNEAREKDHQVTKKEFTKKADQIKLNCVAGKPFWCDQREQMVTSDKICEKIQSTQGCKAGKYSPDHQTGCPLWEAKLSAKATSKPKSKGKGSGKASYQTIMTAIFLDKGFESLDNLVKTINNHPSRQNVERAADAKNVSVGISILKNPNRVKAPLTIDFSRKLKLYFCLDVDGMRTKMAEMEKEYDAKAKEKKAAEKKTEEKKTEEKKTEEKKSTPKKTTPKKTAPKKTAAKPKK